MCAGDSAPAREKAGLFTQTHWSAVLAAGEEDSTEADAALEQLCGSYWYPLYAYVRRQGHGPEDAEDLVQAFFARFLRQRSIRRADPARGRFRTFLLTSLKHFLINEWSKANREKRGSGIRAISLDTTATETRYRSELADTRTPEKAFERLCALGVLNRVLDQLQAEWQNGERGRQFEELKPFLTGEDSPGSYSAIALRLGATEGSLKVAVHRLRQRYRELLRLEVAKTLAEGESVDQEIRDLIAALAD